MESYNIKKFKDLYLNTDSNREWFYFLQQQQKKILEQKQQIKILEKKLKVLEKRDSPPKRHSPPKRDSLPTHLEHNQRPSLPKRNSLPKRDSLPTQFQHNKRPSPPKRKSLPTINEIRLCRNCNQVITGREPYCDNFCELAYVLNKKSPPKS